MLRDYFIIFFQRGHFCSFLLKDPHLNYETLIMSFVLKTKIQSTPSYFGVLKKLYQDLGLEMFVVVDENSRNSCIILFRILLLRFSLKKKEKNANMIEGLDHDFLITDVMQKKGIYRPVYGAKDEQCSPERMRRNEYGLNLSKNNLLTFCRFKLF